MPRLEILGDAASTGAYIQDTLDAIQVNHACHEVQGEQMLVVLAMERVVGVRGLLVVGALFVNLGGGCAAARRASIHYGSQRLCGFIHRLCSCRPHASLFDLYECLWQRQYDIAINVRGRQAPRLWYGA